MLGIPQGELLDRMSSREIAEQMAYDIIEHESPEPAEPTPEEVTAGLLAWRADRRRMAPRTGPPRG